MMATSKSSSMCVDGAMDSKGTLERLIMVEYNEEIYTEFLLGPPSPSLKRPI
jgi:hypothetical protein